MSGLVAFLLTLGAIILSPYLRKEAPNSKSIHNMLTVNFSDNGVDATLLHPPLLVERLCSGARLRPRPRPLSLPPHDGLLLLFCVAPHTAGFGRQRQNWSSQS